MLTLVRRDTMFWIDFTLQFLFLMSFITTNGSLTLKVKIVIGNIFVNMYIF